MLVLIDFQNCFLPNAVWAVPDFNKALQRALSIPINTQNVISTRYVPPCPIEGAWIEYFKDLPVDMQDKNNKCYDLGNIGCFCLIFLKSTSKRSSNKTNY